MVILPGWAKRLPFWDSVSGVGAAVPIRFQCNVEVPVLGASLCLVAAWCSYWVHANLHKKGVCPAKVPGASGVKCVCPVMLCMAAWEAIPNSEEAPCNKVTSSSLTCLDLQVDVTSCSQSLPAK